MEYLPRDIPGLPIFGFDFRLLFEFQTQYNITLQASILRLLVLSLTTLDGVDASLREAVRFKREYRDDGSFANKLYGGGEMPPAAQPSEEEVA